MVVPVETFSAKDAAANELERLGASLTSSSVIFPAESTAKLPLPVPLKE